MEVHQVAFYELTMHQVNLTRALELAPVFSDAPTIAFFAGLNHFLPAVLSSQRLIRLLAGLRRRCRVLQAEEPPATEAAAAAVAKDLKEGSMQYRTPLAQTLAGITASLSLAIGGSGEPGAAAQALVLAQEAAQLSRSSTVYRDAASGLAAHRSEAGAAGDTSFCAGGVASDTSFCAGGAVETASESMDNMKRCERAPMTPMVAECPERTAVGPEDGKHIEDGGRDRATEALGCQHRSAAARARLSVPSKGAAMPADTECGRAACEEPPTAGPPAAGSSGSCEPIGSREVQGEQRVAQQIEDPDARESETKGVFVESVVAAMASALLQAPSARVRAVRWLQHALRLSERDGAGATCGGAGEDGERPSGLCMLQELAAKGLAEAYEAAGALPEALTWRLQAAKSLESRVGLAHPESAEAYAALASTAYHLGDYHRSLGWGEKALMARELRLGPAHFAVAGACDCLGATCEALGLAREALAWYERALGIQEGLPAASDGEAREMREGPFRMRDGYFQSGRERAPSAAEPSVNVRRKSRLLSMHSKYFGPHADGDDGSPHVDSEREEPPRRAVWILDPREHEEDCRGDKGGKQQAEVLAAAWKQRNLEIFEERFGYDHPEVTALCGELGAVCSSKEQYREILHFYEAALRETLEEFGECHAHVAQACQGIGTVKESMGKYTEALSWHTRALGVMEAVLGEEHPNVAAACACLGGVCLLLKDCPAALAWHHKALHVYQKHLGLHPTVGGASNSIGRVLLASGQHEEALQWHRTALQIFKEELGPTHPNVAATCSQVSEVYRNIDGREDNALEWAQRATHLYEDELGPDHPKVATASVVLGRALAQEPEPDFPAALAALQRALQIYEDKLGAGHLNVAAVCSDIGALHLAWSSSERAEAQRGDRAALQWYQRALMLYQEQLGDSHPQVAATCTRLGDAYLQLNLGEDAVELHEHARCIYEEALGPSCPEVARAWRHLGRARMYLQHYSAAVDAFARSRLFWETQCGGSSESQSAESLGEFEAEPAPGRPSAEGGPGASTPSGAPGASSVGERAAEPVSAGAAPKGRKAEAEAEARGEEALCCVHLGEAYQGMACFEDALKWLRRALASRRKLLGDHHPDVAATCRAIADVYSSIAADWLKKASQITEETHVTAAKPGEYSGATTTVATAGAKKTPARAVWGDDGSVRDKHSALVGDPGVHHGAVMKLSGRAQLLPIWQKRYLVIFREMHTFGYYHSEEDFWNAKPSKDVVHSLEDYIIVTSENAVDVQWLGPRRTLLETEFWLAKRDARYYRFRTKTRTGCEEWVQQFQQCINALNDAKQASLDCRPLESHP
ncbi:hypothetical protein CYMTET_16891 [Cymbomonas tetramitiformis]|uniref:PH domain-containing protein n=1 Tax=Cymbomonas tetramitiformis TaxID=36881 RepID=A0AAE0L7V5_9CHLO|nr:hypothetical protein CYMTET_16891 [Cymbomonas tetramitiformis]